VLVLSRKVGEAVVIGGNVRVRVVSIRGTQVRLGVEAPDDVAILRQELHPAFPAPNEQDCDAGLTAVHYR
jgi:carbon storage regulator